LDIYKLNCDFYLLVTLTDALIEKFLSNALINKFNSSRLNAFVCNFKPEPVKLPSSRIQEAKLTSVNRSAILLGMIFCPSK
jgi:hypothetical protein